MVTASPLDEGAFVVVSFLDAGDASSYASGVAAAVVASRKRASAEASFRDVEASS